MAVQGLSRFSCIPLCLWEGSAGQAGLWGLLCTENVSYHAAMVPPSYEQHMPWGRSCLTLNQTVGLLDLKPRVIFNTARSVISTLTGSGSPKSHEAESSTTELG